MKKKILMVDDDSEMCQEMSEVLIEEGYSVSLAFDGINAEKMLKENRYDVLLLDLKIPGMSGFDLLTNARKRDNKAKIIVLTGRPMGDQASIGGSNEELDREEDILKLADRVMNKPFNIGDLLNVLKEISNK